MTSRSRQAHPSGWVFLLDGAMSAYKIIPSLVLMGLGLMAAWVALAVCETGAPVQYFSACVALGYWVLGGLSWPKKA